MFLFWWMKVYKDAGTVILLCKSQIAFTTIDHRLHISNNLYKFITIKMSDSASFTSGPSPASSTSHGYKKSLSSRADPNTALNEHQPSTSPLHFHEPEAEY